MTFNLYPVFMIENAFLRRLITFAVLLPAMVIVAVTLFPVALLIDMILGIGKAVFVQLPKATIAISKEVAGIFHTAIKRGWHGA